MLFDPYQDCGNSFDSRLVEPEILETLDPADPVAVRGRRDLVWINAVMGNHRWLIRQIKKLVMPGERILELGAGDGWLGQQLLKQHLCRPEQLHGMDLVRRPENWPLLSQWTMGNVLSEETLPQVQVVISSLFLHHLNDVELWKLGRSIPDQCRLILAVEPGRASGHVWKARLFLRLAGIEAAFKKL